MYKGIQRLTAALLMTVVTVAATAQWGVPKIAYQQDASEIIMTINGSEVTKEEFSYVLNTMYHSMASMGYTTEMFQNEEAGSALVSYLIENAVEQEKLWHSIVTEFEELDCEIDRTTLDEMDRLRRSDIEASGGHAAWVASLEAEGMNETLYNNTLALMTYQEELYDTYYGEDGIKLNTAQQQDYFEENYIVAKHILFRMTDEMGQMLDDAALAEKHALATKVLEELNAGGDFETLMQTYSEDTGALYYYPDGYVLTEGTTSLAGFTEAAQALEVGEYSDLVETELGWSIIRRYPLDPELLPLYQEEVVILATDGGFEGELTRLCEEAEVVYTENFGDPTSFETLAKYVDFTQN